MNKINLTIIIFIIFSVSIQAEISSEKKWNIETFNNLLVRKQFSAKALEKIILNVFNSHSLNINSKYTDLSNFLATVRLQNSSKFLKIPLETRIQATSLLKNEGVLDLKLVSAIVKNTGRIQKENSSQERERVAMLETLKILIKRKIKVDKRAKLEWIYLLGKTQYMMGESSRKYLKHYIARSRNRERKKHAYDMIHEGVQRAYPKGLPPKEKVKLAKLKSKIL